MIYASHDIKIINCQLAFIHFYLEQCLENCDDSVREFFIIKLMMWYVYILRCADNSLYTGITTALERRLKEHNECNKKGAKYTRVRRPVCLAYSEQQLNRQEASRREYQLKKLTKAKKELLVHAYLENHNRKT